MSIMEVTKLIHENNLLEDIDVIGLSRESDFMIYRKILESVSERANILIDVLPKCFQLLDNDKIIGHQSIRDGLNSLLRCKWKDIEKHSKELYNLIESENRNSLNILIIEALKVFLKIVLELFDYFRSPIHHHYEQRKSVAPQINDEEDTIICRICEENVLLSSIEEHTNYCLIAFKNKYLIEMIQESLQNLNSDIEAKFLNTNWCQCQNKIDSLMILQVYNQIEAAYKSDPSVYETRYLLESIMNHFKSITPSVELSELLIQAIDNISKKFEYCYKIWDASEVLMKTRISGSPCVNTQLMQVCISDFEIINQISRGAYAVVYLVQKKQTHHYYAMKVLPKMAAVEKNTASRIALERDILCSLIDNNIVRFFYSFIAKNNLYFVMEYLPGGNLRSVLNTLGSLDECSAKIYTYEILSALKFLRNCGVIHRDIKPDNMLIDYKGHLKLIDFGLSYLGVSGRHEMDSEEKIISSTSLVGTPHYTSPEMIDRKPHSFSADYWSLGCMLYEFLMGRPPFNCDKKHEIFNEIQKGSYTPLKKGEYSEEVIDLIEKLLKKNPGERIGSNSIDEILCHPWFDNFDYENTPPPFIPELSSEHDTSYHTQENSQNFTIPDPIKEDIADSRQLLIQKKPSFSSVSSTNDDKSHDDDEIGVFPSVQVGNLANENFKNAKFPRKRALSSVDEPKIKSNSFSSKIPIEYIKGTNKGFKYLESINSSKNSCLAETNSRIRKSFAGNNY